MSKIYIQSMPKAGTYFFGAVLEKLGLLNSGFHIHGGFVQHTLAYSDEINRERPTETELGINWTTVLPALPENSFCFGHFPASFSSWCFPRYKYVIAYRDPSETLVSEFIDFRFRRRDLAWISKAEITDDGEAFEAYLTLHGVSHHTVLFSHVIELRRILVRSVAPTMFHPERFAFFDFKKARVSAQEISRLADFVLDGKNDIDSIQILRESLETETKTKATDLRIDREALWTSEAKNIFGKSRLPHLIEDAQKIGLL
ncbi:hypothetical protein ACFPOD_04050 [Nitratireductor kimnyeongensis]|uniref:Sulfotransferase domain-containing protein n=1 Tax=Nitratireductor kimnyeongensis TaxID=430679 RepID=A0ABW0T580_9HYPH|nr:hypothetical protein [Nitratireductor kimnyeongensis]QZZ34732.1 hypothetical protein KW403_13145 [Nitratireductor kimnyeongensis]